MRHRSPLFSDPTTLNRKSLSFPHPTPTTANGLFIITSFAKGVHEGSTPKMYDRLDTVQFMFKAHEIQNGCSSSLGGSPGTYHLYLAPSSSTCGSQSCLACRPQTNGQRKSAEESSLEGVPGLGLEVPHASLLISFACMAVLTCRGVWPVPRAKAGWAW